MNRLRCLSVPLLSATSLVCAAAPVKTAHEAIRRAADAIDKYHLTSLRDECGALSATEGKWSFDVTLRELHTPACGGNPETGPRVFTIQVRKRDGRMTTDAYDGVYYQPLNRKLKRP